MSEEDSVKPPRKILKIAEEEGKHTPRQQEKEEQRVGRLKGRLQTLRSKQQKPHVVP
jgi:hypothetical protein